MIFQHTCRQVLNGTKTQTRRLVKPGEWLAGSPDSREAAALQRARSATSVYIGRVPHERLKWQVNRTYAVQLGRGKCGITRIRITNIRQERLQDITEADVIAEGVRLQQWPGDNYHGRPRTAGYALLWDKIHAKRGTRWADNPKVWVLEFELSEEK